MFFQGNEKYNCATYLRLSRSDGDQQESNSIKNQRALLNDYMGKHPELHKFDEYVDDGYSGTNFERPDFKRMMQDIEKRNVNCIIVKDLSRFGRNYIETGRYLERIFPFMGVRFIAINDHYDSAEENDDKGRILIPFNNLINDTYCRDISMRVRSHLDVKRKEGQFIGSFAGYGYRKDPKDKNHLIIDEYAAGIVQEIFKQKLNGMLAVNDIEKAFSHGNPWLMKFRAISIPEKLERTHLKEWLDHVWIVDFEQVEVILQESEWKRFFPEEWLNNGEEDCNGKKE